LETRVTETNTKPGDRHTGQINIRLSPALLALAHKAAAHRGEPLSKLVRASIARTIRERAADADELRAALTTAMETRA